MEHFVQHIVCSHAKTVRVFVFAKLIYSRYVSRVISGYASDMLPLTTHIIDLYLCVDVDLFCLLAWLCNRGGCAASYGNGYNCVPDGFAGGLISSRSDDVRNLLYEQGSPGRGTARIETTKFLGKSGIQNLDNIPLIRIAEE